MTAQKSGLNKIAEKIRALIRHQQSAQKIGSLNEADAFAAKIQELCNKRRLSVAEMGKEEVASAITFTNFIPEEHGLKALHKREVWFMTLANSVAFGYHCCLLCWPGLNHVAVVGLKTDAETARDMFGILASAALRLCNVAQRATSRRLLRRAVSWAYRTPTAYRSITTTSNRRPRLNRWH